MVFLEGLNLELPRNCLDFGWGSNRQHFQGLPRLKEVSIKMTGLETESENDLKKVIKTLGKSHQLRKLALYLRDSVYDHDEILDELIENLNKWKELQVFRLNTSTKSRITNARFFYFESLVRTCNKMKNLQDLILDIGFHNIDRMTRALKFEPLYRQLKMSQKYRYCSIVLNDGEDQRDEEQDDEEQGDEEQDDEE